MPASLCSLCVLFTGEYPIRALDSRIKACKADMPMLGDQNEKENKLAYGTDKQNNTDLMTEMISMYSTIKKRETIAVTVQSSGGRKTVIESDAQLLAIAHQ